MDVGKITTMKSTNTNTFLYSVLIILTCQMQLVAADTTSVQKVQGLSNELSNYTSFEQADHIIEKFLRKWSLTGASVAIVKDDRLIYAKGLGYADKEKKILATPTHSFRVASISKLITAIAIMKLAEDGSISIDDHVFGKTGILNTAPYTGYTDKRFNDITVRHLLIHEGGWHSKYGDQMFMPHYIARFMGEKLPISDETIIRFALKKGLHYTPGSASSYSNLGYCILGKIIEKVSGMPYSEYVQRQILEPLNIYGMHITSNRFANKKPHEVKFYDAPGAPTRLSVYSSSVYAPRTYEGTDFEALGAAGGWSASAAQLMRLLTAVDGHAIIEDILSCNSIDTMTYLENPDKFGFGWMHSDNMGNWWRTGTLSGTSAFMMRRCDGISFAFVTNTSTNRGAKFAYDIKEMMTEAIDSINWWPNEDLFPYLENSEISFIQDSIHKTPVELKID